VSRHSNPALQLAAIRSILDGLSPTEVIYSFSHERARSNVTAENTNVCRALQGTFLQLISDSGYCRLRRDHAEQI
jgi:hypothetical protein